jgi:hypothetical protein
VSDPRFMPPDFAPKRRREGRSRPRCQPGRRIGAVEVHVFVGASRASRSHSRLSGNRTLVAQ